MINKQTVRYFFRSHSEDCNGRNKKRLLACSISFVFLFILEIFPDEAKTMVHFRRVAFKLFFTESMSLN